MSEKIPYESQEIVICECRSDEHQYIFYYSEDEIEEGKKVPMVYVHPHLITYKSFWERLKSATKYLFGHRTKYGHWDEFMLSPKDAHKFQDIVNYLKKEN